MFLFYDARLNEIEVNNIASNILTEQDKKYRDLELSESVERMQNEKYVVRLKALKKERLFIRMLLGEN